MSTQDEKAIFALLLHAAFADGSKSDLERAALRRMAEALPGGSVNPWQVYQDVLSGQASLSATARSLKSKETRLLAYEMAVGVCETDGPPNDAERTFLTQLRAELGLDLHPAPALAAERDAHQIAAAVPVAAAVDTVPPPLPAPASAEQARPAPDAAQLDKRVLNHAILTGALELLPQSLATMAIVPLQMKLVYGIGKAHGYTLDRGHIRDFMAAAGVGLAAQAVEGYARKLLGGLVGSVLGRGMLGGLGRAATSTGAGAAITFGATYALGQLAIRYYRGGRKMDMAVLRETYTALVEKGRTLFDQNRAVVEQRAASLTPTEVINLVREPA
ncbi:TerB family tellurite resistance protein [Nibricoccus sp. IMCC34717]|uniref:TerB family tellurite resistance protein n=1 Tax=Nibricoccus sp. IMCC34717 TaxID=3034021 RepID=UPI00384AC8F1